MMLGLNWAQWVLITLPAAWGGFMAWLIYGPIPIPIDEDDYGDAIGALEVWLEQPVREAVKLDVREEVAWQRITEREASWPS